MAHAPRPDDPIPSILIVRLTVECPALIAAAAAVASVIRLMDSQFARFMNHSMRPSYSPLANSHSSLADILETAQAIQFVDLIAQPGWPPVLTVEEHAAIMQAMGDSEDEHIMLIVHMTPTLVRLCASVGMNLINTEESQWILDSANALKPDFASSLFDGIYLPRPEHHPYLHELRIQLAGAADGDISSMFAFGCPLWALKDCYTLWEFKWSYNASARGCAYDYLTRVSRNDALNTYYCILCDKDGFHVITALNGSVAQTVQSSSWTTPVLLKFCALLYRINVLGSYY